MTFQRAFCVHLVDSAGLYFDFRKGWSMNKLFSSLAREHDPLRWSRRGNRKGEAESNPALLHG